MADEKGADLPINEKESHSNAPSALEEGGEQNTVLKGWKYKQFKVGPWSTPYYASPRVQLVIVAFVCFMCPGMFNALTGMGGGGMSKLVLIFLGASTNINQETKTQRLRMMPIARCTRHSPSSVSLLEPSPTRSVSSSLSPSVVSDIRSMSLPSSHTHTIRTTASLSLLASSWVSAPVFFGVLRAPS